MTMINHVETTPEMVSNVYDKARKNLTIYKDKTNPRVLTLSEKILIGHLFDIEKDDVNQNLERGKSYVLLRPDRVALQDVTGQMTLLQFMQSGLKRTTLPTTVHCDHLIQARIEGISDTQAAVYENNEVYKFLESASRKCGVGFWKPGAGIIHQVVLENYAFPGGLMIGTDSHTPNAGGLGMVAIGVGGLDAAKAISCTGKATITNMGAEVGATSSVFPYDNRMEIYLRSMGRGTIADLANTHFDLLTPDPEVESEITQDKNNVPKYFDQLIEIDLFKLEPYIVGPHTPDLGRPISKMASEVREHADYVEKISVALIGSCTNSSYEDMSRAADIAEQAKAKGIKTKIPLQVTPGSELIRATIERDGQMQLLKDIGANVLANACGPCIGQWSRPELKKGEQNTIVTSYNRNFPARNDGRRETMNFISSPEIVIALALGGKISFNPLNDELTSSDGTAFKLKPPKVSQEVPQSGFKDVKGVYVPPAEDPESVNVIIKGDSERLQRLESFAEWDKRDFERLPILTKVKGKCTTDHISPAGMWLMYRGHLDNISDNLLLGANNAYHEQVVGRGKNILNGQMESFPHIARDYKNKGMRWIIIGDSNYGEGSSREHAAMTPRYLGCAAAISRSFARIHETNLKKQGVLTLTFKDPLDYDKIMEDDRISITGLNNIKPGKPVKCVLHHHNSNNRTYEEIYLQHSYNELQIEWFYA